MSAYNRITQRFYDGRNLNAADFNASLDDVKARIQAAGVGAGVSGGLSTSVVPAGTLTTRPVVSILADTINVLNYYLPGDTDDAPALQRAIVAAYARNGAVIDVPSRVGGYVWASPIAIDQSRYPVNSGAVIINLFGNKIVQTHDGWGIDVVTNYFGGANGGRGGTKRLIINGMGAVLFGRSTALGGIRFTDTIMATVRELTVYDYSAGVGLQINVSTTVDPPATWAEENQFDSIFISNCMTGAQTNGAAVTSVLGTTFSHITVEGRASNSVLFDFNGGAWNSTFIKCGGFINQSGITGGRGFRLNGSFSGTVFMACWIDSGPDSSGGGAAVLSNTNQVVFGSSYTTFTPWFPTFIAGTLLRPPNWRSQTLWLGPVLRADGSEVSANAREVLRGTRTYYVSTTGNDAADGLAANGAFATIQKAIDTIYQTLDLGSVGVKIKLADGTYTTPVTFQGLPLGLGSGSIILSGNTATLGAVKLSTTNASALSVLGGAQLSIEGITCQTTSGGAGLFADGGSRITILTGCQVASCAGAQIQATTGSTVSVIGAFRMSGSSQAGVRIASNSLFLHGSVAIDATGASWSQNFCDVGDGAKYILNGGTYVITGSTSTNAAGYAHTLGLIQTYGGKPTFPGTGGVFVDTASYGFYN